MRYFRLLITGSRTWPDVFTLERFLDKIYSKMLTHPARRFDELLIVHGACPSGADQMADDWAAECGLKREPYPAHWDQYGRSAGFKRNQYMVNLGADLCVAFIHNSSGGATHCARLAETAGILTVRVTIDD